MRIESSTITVFAHTTTTEIHQKEESLRMWIDGKTADKITISDEAKLSLASQNPAVSAENVEKSKPAVFEISEKDKQKLLLVQKMLESLTGKKIKFYLPEEIKVCNLKENPALYSKPQKAAAKKQGWGLEYNYYEFHSERQTLAFNAEGIIKTADGRKIAFSLELNMSEEFASRINIDMRKGDAAAKDPLVINFNGTAPAITDEKISFDIDCDGTNDVISFLAHGSGFLALDLNEDGIINDGRELFGPKSGNGFAELTQYDTDSNNWIDANDPIYEKLCIWTKDEKGNDVLLALDQIGIGAIYLGNPSTPFELRDNHNEVLGKIQKTGIFIRENGTAGTVQHIDLVL